MPPAGGRRGMLGLIRALETEPAEEGHGPTSPARALALVARHAIDRRVSSSSRRTSAVRATGSRPLTNVAGRHAVIALEIVDPREDALVDVGELTLIDPETGRMLRVDTGDRRLRTAFDEAAADGSRLARRARSPGSASAISDSPPTVRGCPRSPAASPGTPTEQDDPA